MLLFPPALLAFTFSSTKSNKNLLHPSFLVKNRDIVSTKRQNLVPRHPTSIYASLVPEGNPLADTTRSSISGIPYSEVLEGLQRLYPPQDLTTRNAASRTDGYWPFISRGEEPPSDTVYGEFDFYFFAELVDKACHYHAQGRYGSSSPTWDNCVFCDIGSGAGRLVIGAAALHPQLKICRGIELLEGIHKIAQEKVTNELLGADTTQKQLVIENGKALPMAPVELENGSFTDVYFGDTDCAFVASTCFSPALLQELSMSVGKQCKPGTIIITTDHMLPLKGTIQTESGIGGGDYELELLEKVEGWAWITGGVSTAYMHRVKSSLNM
eukprot:CAMPEP_0118700714 /NCGR_PEP_ID=MMETSP0800-20121206/16760_1 /TAXON_ID=210618 ORGANISM="Striatella unipunctata, Strain CCMP2910" /NCGR_SAMPLE_ID=MMETSP0800 /ASSEMBLY_ACC=CAM_ASM_000638 /LENGTH=325 /DNA_ID=CAMNT_0006601377 /DNA_START=1047 /DNA_END=2024 /DNA_ORIENTATION=+